MIAIGKQFKKHRLTICTASIGLIAILMALFLTHSTHNHKVEIFITSRQMVTEHSVDDDVIASYVQNHDPVIKTEDIKAYNPDTNMLFLSDEFLAEHRKGRITPIFSSDIGSVLLDTKYTDSYILTIDEKPTHMGCFPHLAIVSYIPDLVVLKDGFNGLQFANNPLPIYDNVLESFDQDGSIENVFTDMNQLTNDIFDVQSIANFNLSYDIQALYALKTNDLGDNSKINAIADRHIFPEGLKKTSIELQTENHPYTLTIYLRGENVKYIDLSSHNIKDAFRQNSAILLSLIDNLEQVNFIIDRGNDKKTVIINAYRQENLDYPKAESDKSPLINLLEQLDYKFQFQTIDIDLIAENTKNENSVPFVLTDKGILFNSEDMDRELTELEIDAFNALLMTADFSGSQVKPAIIKAFNCQTGAVINDQIILIGENGKLTLKEKNGTYFIASFLKTA